MWTWSWFSKFSKNFEKGTFSEFFTIKYTPVFLPGESQGRGSLVGCRLWGRTELDTTEATCSSRRGQGGSSQCQLVHTVDLGELGKRASSDFHWHSALLPNVLGWGTAHTVVHHGPPSYVLLGLLEKLQIRWYSWDFVALWYICCANYCHWGIGFWAPTGQKAVCPLWGAPLGPWKGSQPIHETFHPWDKHFPFFILR